MLRFLWNCSLIIVLTASMMQAEKKNASYFKESHFHSIRSCQQKMTWTDEPEICAGFRDDHLISTALPHFAECGDTCLSDASVDRNDVSFQFLRYSLMPVLLQMKSGYCLLCAKMPRLRVIRHII